KGANMKRLILAVCLVVPAVIYSVIAASEARMMPERSLRPIETLSPQQLMVDVVTRERDLLKITSQWPDSLTVENISDKEVSGFRIEISAANDEGGPGRHMGWGKMPGYGIQSSLFKPHEVITLAINAEIVKTFQENGKPFIYIQLAEVWVNNDPLIMYKYGAELRQDPQNPKRYIVVKNAKCRIIKPVRHKSYPP